MNSKNWLAVVIVSILVSSQAEGALVFSVASQTYTAGSAPASILAEIRVSGNVSDNLQFYAIQAQIETLTGSNTLTLAPIGTLDTLTNRDAAPYVLFDRGTNASGGPASTYLTRVDGSIARFQDGVSFTTIFGGAGTGAVTPGASPGLLIGRLQFTPTSPLAEGDSFRLNLSGLTVNSNAFSAGGPLTTPLQFTSAGTGVTGEATGVDLGGSVQFSNGVFTITAVPEPSTCILVGLAAGSTILRGFSRKRKSRDVQR